MAPLKGTAAAARRPASGYALGSLPRIKDLHHFPGHQLSFWVGGDANVRGARVSGRVTQLCGSRTTRRRALRVRPARAISPGWRCLRS